MAAISLTWRFNEDSIDLMENFKRLVEIIAALRGPDGCPWDKEQDHNSLKPYIVEEVHEVIAAIADHDDEKLSEELGDLLSQIVMHAQLARERGAFDLETVAEKIADKLTARHPHVFGDKKELTSEEVLHNWERIKHQNANDHDYSVLQGVPPSLPALLKAYRVQEKVGRYGFDWKAPDEVVIKLKEEITEFENALKTGERAKQEEELGDLLFSLVNLGRHLQMQAEEALNRKVQKFIRRFQYIENRLRQKGKKLDDSSLDEMDALWEHAKKEIE
jgi:tetrapyrrole methylase family protein/MazG family protein